MKSKVGRKYSGSLEDLPVLDEGSHSGAVRRVIFGPGLFWDDHVARFFSLSPGAASPFHDHDWPHYVFILEGNGEAQIMGETWRIKAGSWAFVPPCTGHCFTNTGSGPLKFICIVPERGDPFRG
ncbi:MAG TPA: cupin domain-containing protein [Synergistales bacterium]|nr:cupin domain-containing protein [Synergistales bacterium]MDI9392223.1 cupin domain-containing protein [Synergistota bacterium]MDY0178918.1 cupin domain-containing protein [Synergistaceae bacterium]HRW87788.1 cupin domain-containing protein [Thermovirgaceae bacterium]MDD3134073.1 cupin domain-containing protein [Synergistales bacterium]